MSAVIINFDAVDTWFFRESRPYGTIGGSELVSVFPPPARTVVGVVRSLVGESLGTDWREYKNNPDYVIDSVKLRDVIGFSDDLGRLKFSGPYLTQGGKRLFPTPALLMKKDNPISKLLPGNPVFCDLGKIQLPVISPDEKSWKSIENTWITQYTLKVILSGQTPTSDQLIPAEKLFTNESRLGIGRNNDRRTADKGLLYQTRHIRPLDGVTIEVEVEGLEQSILDKIGAQRIIRTGGDGRLSAVSVSPKPTGTTLPMPETLSGDRIMLILLTHADFGGSWKPLEFADIKDSDGNTTAWQGVINDIPLTLVSAIIGKAVREGGWNLADNKPKTVKSLVPAGSVYFCRVDGDIQEACNALHGLKIGNDTKYGRGELVVGVW